MKIEKGDLLTLDDSSNVKYLVIDRILFEDMEYIFTNEVIDEEIGDKYHIYKVDNDYLDEIYDEKMHELLMPMFNKEINRLLEEEKYSVEEG